jgi:enamine deaminase RidA (YjgF/YER057c/UK114 family)
VTVQTRIIESAQATELYFTATPSPHLDPAEQAKELFAAIADLLHDTNTRLLQERVFATPQAAETIAPIRTKMYGDLDDGVAPTWLAVPQGRAGPISAVQIHAVAGEFATEILHLTDTPCGRLVKLPGRGYLVISGITGHEADSRDVQAHLMLEKAESLLKQAGIDFFHIARTWMWLADILDWYDRFNEVRNKFFIERGLIRKDGDNTLPASTGIGIGPANNGAACALDLVAVIDGSSPIDYLLAGGRQYCAYNYGSAFARATGAKTPAGRTIFVSGTASIAADGATVHVGDAAAQIEDTVRNVRAVLKDMKCTDDDVVHSIMYCKTPEIETLFHDKWANFPWPHFTTITDICRHDLLFEIEATAAVPAKP